MALAVDPFVKFQVSQPGEVRAYAVLSNMLMVLLQPAGNGVMNLEASRFGKHAVQHIQIPEAELHLTCTTFFKGFVPVLAAQCGVMLQPMLVKDLK
ncbi:hypothetical protein DAPPUDRAFT_318176 [Daphnia pulex]|uniref:Uncharacterized protein n=1 Tax=Daphnia pulex TaxID=6669 RepID=E9GI36_DAPPU|nr:hypothetical protein DAPPUDRAFT_318176 [Daphnia pulex]|eukprot:EFX80945.1 hypothetical protein DAPPUDRAFT_318176 [Daphnia pulex]